MAEDFSRHHMWCNFFSEPREGCRQCADLYTRFPMTGTEDQMMAKHFPDAIKIPRLK